LHNAPALPLRNSTEGAQERGFPAPWRSAHHG
jgi:hypothetical protein